MYNIDNIKKDFNKLFWPILATFAFSFLVNIIDLYFAGKINNEAIGALQATFPIIFLLISIYEGISNSTNNLLSISLGQNNKKNLNLVFTVALIFCIFLGAIFFIFSKNISYFLLSYINLNNNTFILAYNYLSVIFNFSFFYFFMGIIFSSLIVFQKKIGQLILGIISIISNITLNYIFVIKYNLGTKGLALATGITMCIISIIYIIKYIYIEKMFTITFDKKEKIKEIAIKYISYFTGAFLSLFIVSFEFLVNNYFISQISTYALSSYAIVSRSFNLFLYPAFAISIVFSTMLAYWFGKNNKKNMQILFKKFIKYIMIYSIISFFIIIFLFKYVVYLFTINKTIISYSIYLFNIQAIFILFFPIYFLFNQVFQVLGFHKTRIGLSILSLIFISIFEYIFFSYKKSFESIWLGWLLAEFLMFNITYIIIKYYKKII